MSRAKSFALSSTKASMRTFTHYTNSIVLPAISKRQHWTFQCGGNAKVNRYVIKFDNAFSPQADLDEIETIMCINFIRAQHEKGTDVRSELATALAGRRRPWKADQYMQPVIENDPLLTHDWDEEDMDSGPR